MVIVDVERRMVYYPVEGLNVSLRRVAAFLSVEEARRALRVVVHKEAWGQSQAEHRL
jgi:hypothetical protein